MRKFAFADENGRTVDNVQLKTGKFLTDAGSKEELVFKTVHSIGSSAEVAALVSREDPEKHHLKLYSIEEWAVDANDKNGKVYLVVKEVEAPVVRLEQKLQFAVATLGNLIKDKAFRAWANNWLNKSDRNAAAATEIEKAAQEELDGIAQLVEMGISTGESHEDMQKQKDTLNRIVALTKAAAMATDASKADDDVSKLIADAITDIQNFYKADNLIKLAEKICAK